MIAHGPRIARTPRTAGIAPGAGGATPAAGAGGWVAFAVGGGTAVREGREERGRLLFGIR